MKALFVDCPTGLAGDMLIAAFLDLGVPKSCIEKALLLTDLKKAFSLNVEESRSYGIRGIRVCIETYESESNLRRWIDIKELIVNSDLVSSIKENVLSVFKLLAEAEASVHGCRLDEVHFHELGGIDALVDVIGVCAAIEYLGVKKIFCTSPPAGSGKVSTSHGILPVPVPVVLELARLTQINLIGGEGYQEGELTTPTGLALMAVLSDCFRQPVSFGVHSIGVGLGHRKLDRPNFLRICEFDDIETGDSNSSIKGLKWQAIISQEAWIDDSTPEDLAVLIKDLRSAGAIDVVSSPIQMKKGRQGLNLKAIMRPEDAENVRAAWFSNGTTLGVRETSIGRWVAPRRRGYCNTLFGKVGAKQARRPDGRITVKPEHEELVRLVRETGKSLDEIRNTTLFAEDNFIPSEDWL